MKRFLPGLLDFAWYWLLATLLIATLQPNHDRNWQAMLVSAVLWGAVTAAVFLLVRRWRRRRGEYCALCGDTSPTDTGHS